MKRPSLRRNFDYVLGTLRQANRRKQWFGENLTSRKILNLVVAGTQFALKQEVMRAWPTVVKVDLSPLCNLHCTVCIHARPNESSGSALKAQNFDGSQKMRLDQFEQIMDEVSGKTMAVSMYYLGDPFVHPDLDAMCRIARNAGLNSHVSTNFSFSLSDRRIASIVTSGLTHLTVCIDGLSQETYGRTRVGGRVDVVVDNLERLLRYRRESDSTYPRVEVQFIKFQHNVDELEEAVRRFRALGVDQFTDFWGSLHNYTDFVASRDAPPKPKERRSISQCYWPHFALLIKYDGDVIPCCHHRTDAQYSGSMDQRVIGNVFESSVWDVWNSTEYQALRRLVGDPQRVHDEASLAQTFCAGCQRIFETDSAEHVRGARAHRWEDLYMVDEGDRVVRKAQ